jgi:poly(beta-D-mannuronate) lyase
MQVHAQSREVRHSKLTDALLTASVALMGLLPGGTLYAQTEVTPAAGAVTASANDGNVPGNTVDNSLATRWSANGDGQ